MAPVRPNRDRLTELRGNLRELYRARRAATNAKRLREIESRIDRVAAEINQLFEDVEASR